MFLDEFAQITGYNRCYSSQVLGKSKILGYVKIAGEKIKYVTDHKKSRRKKKKYYYQEILLALNQLWEEADSICSKTADPLHGRIYSGTGKIQRNQVNQPSKRKVLFYLCCHH
jgi:hypothetical protein